MNEIIKQRPFRRNGKTLRGSKKNVLFYTTDCGGSEDNNESPTNLHQRSVSLTALHIQQQGNSQQQKYQLPRLETLEAKMANIEVSLSSSGSGNSPIKRKEHIKNRDFFKEIDNLRVALRDKENVIQNLKGQLCSTLSNRLALRNGAPPLNETDRKTTEERLQRLKRDSDNKRLAIKNLKIALERLDITDNIDVRIQQAELEYRLGREELELLTIREETRALQTVLELADAQKKQKTHTLFSCITGNNNISIHAVEISADPKCPRFGASTKENASGLYVDWAVEDSGLCKGDRIIEVNGKLVVGAERSDLARLLAVAPDAAQIVVLRKGESSLSTLRALRSDNIRLTHRISYLEEQVRDLLEPNRQEVSQVFQKGPEVTTLVNPIPDPTISSNNKKDRNSKRHSHRMHLAKSTASLDHVNRKHQQYDIDSEPSFNRQLDNQSRGSEHSALNRPAPPKKPLRLSLQRAASLQSVESAPPSTSQSSRKPTKRNYRGDPPPSNSESSPPQPPPRTPSRAESCQSALKWPSPKPMKPHIPQISIEKWC